MRYLIIGFLLLPIVVSAQTQVSIYTGTNFPYVWGTKEGYVELGDFRDGWYPAINLGGSIQFSVASWFEVSPCVEYNLYLFRKYQQYTVAAPPILTRSSGHASHVLRLMMEARFVDRSAEPTRVYAVTGLGYVMKRIGSTDLIWSIPDATTRAEYPTKYGLVHLLGFGVQQRLSDLYLFDLGIKCYADYINPIDLSINFGVTYKLQE
jgi:hypothetical protein